MSQKLRIAVIGVGHLGKEHARIYSKMKGVELVAVCDTIPERVEEVAKGVGSPAVTDYHQLFGKVEVVSIAVPTVSHYDIASEFLRRGIHCLVEKPLTKTIPQAEELVKIARSNGAILQVGHVERFNPAVMAVSNIVGKPRFIECHRLSTFKARSVDIDVVMDLMIHDIDIILHFVKSPLKKVDAVGVSLLFDHEDIANARLEFEDGCIANVTASRISDKAMRKIRIFSDDKYVSLDYAERTAKAYK
ncbi:MAG: UDP-N-acetyl-D-glucosamine dehydrogenase, partial [Planctomycetes bacterium RBG_16_43_13]